MRKVITFLMSLAFLGLVVTALQAQDRFDRSAVIPVEADDVGGIGNIVAGVDFDGDGKLEIYTVNNDWFDVIGGDLVPRLYKYEQNDGVWEIVWSTALPLNFQNTWPALAAADLDQDGKWEIVFGPSNNFGGGNQPNPERIFVYETVGDGSDVMGIDNGDGTYAPNASWTILSTPSTELRPFRWHITDIDGDGTDEIVTSIRSSAFGMGIFSVDDIPDNGDGSETWTEEFLGLPAGNYYDIFVIGSTAWAIRDNGDVTAVSWDGSNYVVGDVQANAVPSGSWKSSVVVDLDNDETPEVLVASWGTATNDVYLLQVGADGVTLTTTLVADLPASAGRLYGGAAGDLNNNGLTDYVFGTRGSNPLGQIINLAYQGGDITSPDSYSWTVLDAGISNAQQYDVISVANIDGDADDEVIYAGLPRGQTLNDTPPPIVVLDRINPNQPKILAVQDVPNDNGRQVWVVWEGAADDRGGMRFSSDLSGANEVPPVNTVGSGRATYILDQEAKELWYMLEVYNIDSVTQAHIHVGAPDVNGGVVAFLFGRVAGGGPVNGVLSRGVIRPENLIGPLAGDWDAFVTNLLSGNLYTNVHTTTFGAGEIRGQIVADPLTGKAKTPSVSPEGFTISHYIVWRIDDGFPVQVARTDAIQAANYAAVVPTLGDGDDYAATYVVTAHTPRVDVLWKSFPASGTSEDNLIPSPPSGFRAEIAQAEETGIFVDLRWDEPRDPDIRYWELYRSTTPDFDPDAVGALAQTAELGFVDTDFQLNVGESYFYKVVAYDFSGNRGIFSEEIAVLFTSVGDQPGSGVPNAFALHPSYPNPFNPTTTIRFDVAEHGNVSIVIYNMMGQKVRELVSENRAPGSYTVTWDARDDFGQKVSSGVYISVMRAPNFTQRQRMTLLK